jgi:hypothetical protein
MCVFIILVALAASWRRSTLLVALGHHAVHLLGFALIWHIANARGWRHLGLWIRPLLPVSHHGLSLGVLAGLWRWSRIHGPRVVEVLAGRVGNALLHSSWWSACRCRRYRTRITQCRVDGQWLAALSILNVGTIPLIRAALVAHAHDA